MITPTGRMQMPKLRIENYRLTNSKLTETSAQICWRPRPYKKDGKSINLYDDEFECCFDKISWKGLDIWTYAKLLEAERSRLKSEYR